MSGFLELSPEQLALRDSVSAFFAKESPSERVRSAQPLGFDPRLWERVRALGVPDMGLRGQATLADLTIVAEEHGRHLAPVPIVEALVAARVLERLGACPTEVTDGAAIATLALRAGVDGVARLVPAGACAAVVVALEGDELVAVRAEPPGPDGALANLGSSPLADRSLEENRHVLARGADAAAAHAVALDEWRLLTAAALVGLARGVLELGVEYAKVRRQFGVPIGSFQAVQHRLADAATALDGAGLLVRAAATADTRRATLAAMAFWYAGRAARDVAGVSLHVHGGYGFMDEYDVQLYFRRAAAWVLALGDPAGELAHVADLLDAEGWLGEEGAATGFRAEVRAFLEQHCTPDVVEAAARTGTVHDWRLHRALAHAGWLAAEWPVERGGQARDPFEMLVLAEEMARAGAPIDGWGTSNLVAHTLEVAGNDEQRREIVPRILRGEILCCLGYSEPDAGSDVAAASTRAVRDGETWVINGQKMFTTLAHESAYVFLLTRTDPDAAKHRGLTMFLVPMTAPGIEIAPIRTLGGERTNVTFYTDVRVPDSCRVGEVDRGWEVLNVALVYERQPVAQGEAARLYRRVAGWAATTERDGRRVADQPATRDRLARVAVDLEVGRLLGHRLTTLVARGELPAVEASMAKLFCSEAFVRAAGELLDLMGPPGVLGHGVTGAPAGGWTEHAHRHAQVMTIYAGTSEIQRSIIAERGLGLPRGSR